MAQARNGSHRVQRHRRRRAVRPFVHVIGSERAGRGVRVATAFVVRRRHACARYATPWNVRRLSCRNPRPMSGLWCAAPPAHARSGPSVVGGEPERAVRPWRTSRMRSRSCASSRSSLRTFSPSSSSRTSNCPASAPTNRLPRQAGNMAAGVERHPGGRDRGHPVPDRLLHAGLLRALVDLGAAVVDAVADHRPAVVLALLDDVDLVAAARPVLVLPQLAGRRDAARVPASCDGRSSRFPAWRLAGRRTDCPAAPSRRAGCERSCRDGWRDSAPRSRERAMVAHAEEQIVVGGLRDAAAEMIAARERAVLAEDHLDVVEAGRVLSSIEPRARQRGACAAARRFGIAEIDRVVFARSRDRARRRAARPGPTQRPSARRQAPARSCRPCRRRACAPAAR